MPVLPYTLETDKGEPMAETAAGDARNARLADLLYRSASGDRAAFAALYRETAPTLFAWLLRLLRRRALAEEVLQDVFVSVWQHAAEYDAAKGRVMSWLARMTRNRALDRLRRERRLVPLDELAAAEEGGEAPEEPRSHVEERALAECFEALAEGPRRSLRLAYLSGLSHEEIARALGAPLGTVKSWVRRGLASLKRCLEGA